MNGKRQSERAYNIAFIVMDMACLQLGFILSYWLFRGFGNPYGEEAYAYQALVLTLSQVFVILFLNSYDGLFKRGIYDEIFSVSAFSLKTVGVALVYLFVVHRSWVASRLQFGFTAVIFAAADLIARTVFKALHEKRIAGKRHRTTAVLITSAELLKSVAGKDLAENREGMEITGIIVTGAGEDLPESLEGIPVEPWTEDTVEDLGRIWPDEVLIMAGKGPVIPGDVMDRLVGMGITVNVYVDALDRENWPVTELRTVSGHTVLSGSLKTRSAGQRFLKRLMDIVGSIIGCIITGILFIFVAPAIKRASPGPVFFTQERVGKNGKIIKIHKFRSMYPDADVDKEALLERNKVRDGMMFKVEDDPRIIGNGKYDRKGRPKGVGHFIRRRSIDEFPQFFDVLRGDMSIVGTRPPTLDEWNR